MQKTDDYKVLRFDLKQGEVPGHEIRRTTYDWHDPVKWVVFDIWDHASSMGVEVHIHWTEWTRWSKRRWPACGSVKAVITESGRRMFASSLSVHHYDEAAYLAAPHICRDVFAITVSDHYVLEVVGVREWAHSKRDAAATERWLINPWERDNAAYRARFPHIAEA